MREVNVSFNENSFQAQFENGRLRGALKIDIGTLDFDLLASADFVQGVLKGLLFFLTTRGTEEAVFEIQAILEFFEEVARDLNKDFEN